MWKVLILSVILIVGSLLTGCTSTETDRTLDVTVVHEDLIEDELYVDVIFGQSDLDEKGLMK